MLYYYYYKEGKESTFSHHEGFCWKKEQISSVWQTTCWWWWHIFSLGVVKIMNNFTAIDWLCSFLYGLFVLKVFSYLLLLSHKSIKQFQTNVVVSNTVDVCCPVLNRIKFTWCLHHVFRFLIYWFLYKTFALKRWEIQDVKFIEPHINLIHLFWTLRENTMHTWTLQGSNPSLDF